MTEKLHSGNDFLKQVVSVIEQHLGNENFEVPDLAGELNMSRSSLLRKVKALTGLSVSLFIRKVRLYHAREMLNDERLTASEVSFKVGFNSPSYFTKCFREEFGYTPGEQKHLPENQIKTEEASPDAYPPGELPASSKQTRRVWFPALVIAAGILAGLWYFLDSGESSRSLPEEKTIAVLPFKNDSGDSSNIYLVNGMMQSILNHLQQIEDLKVTSRTTTEKYRNSGKSIPELAREMEVNYFVEGSGQKSGDQIMLTIVLIDGTNDRNIWSKQFIEKTDDIFKLQADVARNIAQEIQVVITPEVRQRIAKRPTDNLEAYDSYLRGLNEINTPGGLQEGIAHFKDAIEKDPEFSQAYAYVAISYYYLDIFQANKIYGEEINNYADKAVFYDAEAAESMIAKGMFYMQDQQHELAVQYFKKALTYSPNSAWIHNFLSDIYANYLPNTDLYLAHALQGVRTAVAEQDSVRASFTYLHLANALAQTGFIKEAGNYLEKSLDYNPDNYYSRYLRSFTRLAAHSNLQRTKEELQNLYEEDTTRIDVLQDLAKICYMMENYKEAWKYYERFVQRKELLDLDIYPGEDLKIAFVLSEIGKDEMAQQYYDQYRKFSINDESIYKEIILGSYDAAMGNIEEGIGHLKEFANVDNIQYWVILFLDKDPIIQKLSVHREYENSIKQMKENFWRQHRERKRLLEREGILLE